MIRVPRFVWAILGLLILGLVGYFTYGYIDELKSEKSRLERNQKLTNQKLQVSEAKNGELITSTEAMTVKANELKFLNQELVDKVDNMKIKLKNLQSITDIGLDYSVYIDTIPYYMKPETLKLTDTTYTTSFGDDKFISLKTQVNIPKQLMLSIVNKDSVSKEHYPFLSNITLNLKDTLTIAPEWQYKRRWIFWKKPVGVKVHVKGENKYLKIDQIETFQIQK